ncbi:MAG: hypothetical protein ACRDV1_08865 [Actinomycetes bacterium]
MAPHDVDDDDVRSAASTLLGRPVTAVTWQAEPVDPQLRFHSVTAGVVRVRGTAEGEDFSVIVKQTRLGVDDDPNALWVSGADPEHRNYWKREWFAYASGLLGRLPGRLRAPRLLLATEPAPDVAWLWLEDVRGRSGTEWADADYAAAARDLGLTQGAFATGAKLPDEPWLSRDWLESWLHTTERWWSLLTDDGAWEDERVAKLAALRPRARAVLAEHAALLQVAREVPRTVVHLDLWPTNLFAGDDGHTIAIDWSSVGIGGLASDLDQLTLDPVWMQVRPDDDLDALERAVVSAYAEGLRTAGMGVDDAQVRQWYAVAAALRYIPMLAAQAEVAADPARVAGLERRWTRPFAAIAADRARVVGQAVALAEECLSKGTG